MWVIKADGMYVKSIEGGLWISDVLDDAKTFREKEHALRFLGEAVGQNLGVDKNWRVIDLSQPFEK